MHTGSHSNAAYTSPLFLQSHGVYEGSYWQLLGDLEEIEAMLSRMTRAPSLFDEPELQLPPEPDLPK
jgi:hypothetical protein